MAITTILDNEFVSVWFHPESKIIHHQFKRFVHGENLRNALTKGAETMEEFLATKWLSDDRGNTALPPDDEQWAQTIWAPRVMKAGWKHWALVQPVKVVGQMNVKRFAETYAALGINAKIFSDPDEALAWLEVQ